MKKILTLLCLVATNSLVGQVLLSENDVALLEKLKTSRLFYEDQSANAGGVGSAQMLSLRGITKVGKFWYFSIYDASLNSCFWVKLKDGDRELALIKANFFDDENKELEIVTDSYTHILALKERDPLTGPVPSILNSGGNRGSGGMSKGQQMGQMLSGMNTGQRAAMAMQLVASMAGGNNGQMMMGQGMMQGNMQGNMQNMQGNNNSSNNKSSNKSSSKSSNKSSGKSSSGKK